MKFNKILMSIGLMTSFSGITSVSAAEVIIRELVCTEINTTKGNSVGIEIKIFADEWSIEENASPSLENSSKIKNLTFNLVSNTESKYKPHRSFEMSTVSFEEVLNDRYSARKYSGHYRFSLGSLDNMYKAGQIGYDRANLILSPQYEVVKKYAEANIHTPSWKWTVEVRKYPAVLDLSINDHHGDYIDLECYSTARADEKGRPERKSGQ